MRPALTATIAALACAAAAPAAASAATDVYDVKYVGEATYERVDVTAQPTFDARREVRAKLRWTLLGEATFRDGVLLRSSALTGGVLGQGTEAYQSTDRWSDGTVVRRTQACAGENDQSVPDAGLLERIDTGLGPALQVNPTANIEIVQSCDDGTKRTQQFLGHGDPLLTGRFLLPREAVGQGKIIQLLEGEGTAPCPMTGGATKQCSFTWKGELTFIRIGGDPAPQPPAPQPPAPQPPAPPAGQSPTPPAPRVTPPADRAPAAEAARTVTAKLARRGRSATVTVPCATACRGTVDARVGGKRVSGVRFRAPAGATKRVTLRFDVSARRAIARAGRVTLEVRGTGVPAKRLVLRT